MVNDDSFVIRKALRVIGKSLAFRNAAVGDAEFILSLRTDEDRSRYLSYTSPDLRAQQDWLAKYAEASDQAYFIIESLEGEPFGTVRLYDSKGDSFCWGSWILKRDRPSWAAMESALMVYSYAVDHLGFHRSHFDVRKGNEKVWTFHERFGAVRVAENELDYFYELGLDAIRTSLAKYRKYLPESVSVEWLNTVSN